MSGPGFLAGVVEGFYGPPWSHAERTGLLDRMAAWGMNAYLYAPKDDLKHRALWREPYAPAEAAELAALLRASGERGIRLVFALSPGLDIRYGDPADLDRLAGRVEQVLALGGADFALLFDDIPDGMREEDRRLLGSLARAQCHVAGAVHRRLRERSPGGRFLFCPTPYCSRMARGGIGGPGYLETVGRELPPDVDVLWTGPEIVSREITLAHAREVRAVLRRPPLIWDNLHANDYDGRRFFCGPYAGRPPGLRAEVRGLLLNPNVELPLDDVPLATFAAYLRCGGEWDPRAAWAEAMAEWRPRLATTRGEPALDDLLLFGDCFYLPHAEGPGAEALAQRARRLVARPAAAWGDDADALGEEATRLRDFCAGLSDLRDRALFRAVHRRAWELREELDLLLGFVRARREGKDAAFRSDFHLPGTYRGGMLARLQGLLALRPDGVLEPSAGGAITATADPHAP